MRKVFVLLLTSLIVMLTMSLMFTSVASADDPPYLKFKITDAGQTGTITLYYAGGTESWDANSGDNKPDHQYVDAEFGCGYGGPIPKGTWKAYEWEPWKTHGCWPIGKLNPRDTLACTRDRILIHAGSTTTGCIAVSNFNDFNDTLTYHWPAGASTIKLIVSYPDAAYGCDPDPECCNNGGQLAHAGPSNCCNKGPNKDKKDYCPENPEKGCCQYGEECYDNNGNEWYRDECEKCYEGEWHSGNACCPPGSPGGTCYNISNPKDGCCQYKVNNEDKCYDDIHPPDKCDKCYGGSWKPGWHCEEGECVPEASTLVLFATGLLFLAGYLGFRRKEN